MIINTFTLMDAHKSSPFDPMERFNITGVCPSCGKPIGTLAPMPDTSLLGFPNHKLRLVDNVIYHVSPYMTKATIRCNEEPG